MKVIPKAFLLQTVLVAQKRWGRSCPSEPGSQTASGYLLPLPTLSVCANLPPRMASRATEGSGAHLREALVILVFLPSSGRMASCLSLRGP